MVKFLFCLVILILIYLPGKGQLYQLQDGEITIFATAPISNIEAVHHDFNSEINLTTDSIEFKIRNRGFDFTKNLMEKHFNEKYIESDKYPLSTFKGVLSGYDNSKTGIEQKAKAKGKLTIHGKTRDVEIEGTIKIEDQNILINSVFLIKLEDYSIPIPTLMFLKASEEIEVTVNLVYKHRTEFFK